jgi:hypothetical protein
MSTVWHTLIQKRCVNSSYCLCGSWNQWYIHPTYNFAHRIRLIQWALPLALALLQILCGRIRVRSVWKSKVEVVSKVVPRKVPMVVVKKAVTGKLMHEVWRFWHGGICLDSYWIQTFSNHGSYKNFSCNAHWKLGHERQIRVHTTLVIHRL